MRVLVVGEGGREHALAWGLSRSSIVDEVISAPGNPGMAALGECVNVSAEDIGRLTDLAVDRGIDLVVVGPEAPLVAGLGDALSERNVRTFGPRRSGARLEGSKSFAKNLMGKYGIPTAKAREFEEPGEATRYVESLARPVVVKADGIAAGKGVTVCETVAEARAAIHESLEARRFGAAGSRIVIEERLEGPELSVLAFFDGKTLLPMQAAQDYKRVFDDDRGPNTGGMGSYSPVPIAPQPVVDRITDLVLEPIAGALEREGVPYSGVIYAGLMMTEEGPKVLEFNCRFGDPETQALIPRLGSDLAEPILACAESSLAGVKLHWHDEVCVCVAAASGGYPGNYQTGFPISGVEEAEKITGLPVLHAGTVLEEDGRLLTAGGRVLGVVGLGVDHSEARNKAYEAMSKVIFEGMHYRRDIAEAAASAGPDREQARRVYGN